MNIVYICMLACAASALAAFSDDTFAARLVFKDGRQYQCLVLGCDSGTVTIARSLNGSTVRERHRMDTLDALHAPCPACVTQAPPSDATLGKALADTAAECARWKPYDGIKGAWFAPCALAHARLLERDGKHTDALALFRQLASVPALAADADEIAVRIALLSAHASASSNALAALRAALPRARSDADRAELWYAIGCMHARRGEHVNSLFALLAIPVFYSHVPGWEPRSLYAALPSFAALNRRDDYLATCDTLVRRFPDSAYAACASNAQARVRAGMPLSSMTSLTFAIKEQSTKSEPDPIRLFTIKEPL